MIPKYALWGALLLAGTLVSSAAGASEPLRLQLGGYMHQYFGGVKSLKNGNLGGGSSGFGHDRAVRLYFDAATTLDSGVTIGGHINVRSEGSGQSLNIKRQYAWASGDFGWLGVGEHNGVVDRFAVLAPGLGGRDNQELMDWINTSYTGGGAAGPIKGNVDRIPTLKTYIDDNAPRVMYISPSYHGVSAGVSYAPYAEVGRGLGVRARNQRRGSNEVQAGIAYATTVREVKINWDASFSATFDGSSRRLYRTGLSFEYDAWTIGGGYLGTSSADDELGSVWNYGTNHVFRENLWEVGVRFRKGQYGLAAIHAQNDSSLGDAMLTQVAASYQLGSGLTVIGQVFYGESDARIDPEAERRFDKSYRNGLGLVTGVLLQF